MMIFVVYFAYSIGNTTAKLS